MGALVCSGSAGHALHAFLAYGFWLVGDTTMRAIVLFAHGSRDPLWHGPITAIAARIREISPDQEVRCAYLELTEPSLPQVAQELSDLGCTELHITPLFLGVGKHAREDLPHLISQLKEDHPSIQLSCAQSIGEDLRIIDLVAQIALRP